MPIYSEVISDELILRQIPNTQCHILIIGCGACMNESLAYKNSLPIYKGDPTMPYATIIEINRISKMLKEKEFCVDTKFYNDIDGFFCMTDIKTDKHPISLTICPDIILILSCDAGYLYLCEKFPNIKVIKITKQTGFISYVYNEFEQQRTIIKNKSIVIPLNVEK